MRLVHSEYGSASSFTLAGSAAAGRLGLAEGTYADTDVQGTIGDFAATGSGQLLTGSVGSMAEGLAVRYMGSSYDPSGATSVGTVNHALGIAGGTARLASLIGRSGDGTVAIQLDSLEKSQDRLSRRISDAEARLEQRRDTMLKQFSRMEEALSRIQAQGNWLANQIKALQASQR